MHLSGDHEIDLIRRSLEMVKINRVPPAAFGEKYQVIEAVAVRKNKALMFVNVMRKPCDHNMIFAVLGKRADIEPGK